MANFQRQTKNSTKHQHRESFGGTPERPPQTVAQQYAELNAKIKQLIDSNAKLETNINTLLSKVETLEEQNKSLADANAVLRADNKALSSKLTAAEVRLSSIESEIESNKQKALQNTVELLEVPSEAKEDVLGFVKTYAQEIGCAFSEADLDKYYSRTTTTRSNVTKTKIILEFSSLKKRKEFYFAGRDHRFNKDQQGPQQERRGGLRHIKVVDALTHYKKSIFFDIIDKRKTRHGVIKNVWISEGEIFIRRFGRTVAEPVRNQSFVDLLFPAVSDDE
jgi:regulator of replication initiation timing